MATRRDEERRPLMRLHQFDLAKKLEYTCRAIDREYLDRKLYAGLQKHVKKFKQDKKIRIGRTYRFFSRELIRSALNGLLFRVLRIRYARDEKGQRLSGEPLEAMCQRLDTGDCIVIRITELKNLKVTKIKHQ